MADEIARCDALKISPHFTMAEVVRSRTAARLGINNTLPEQYIRNAKAVAINILEPVRCEYDTPFTPNSWYRCPELNTAIGGSKNSQHMEGGTVDFELVKIDNLVVAEFVMRELDFDQLILEFYDGEDPNSGWIHCSYVSWEKNRRSVLQYDGKNYLPWN